MQQGSVYEVQTEMAQAGEHLLDLLSSGLSHDAGLSDCSSWFSEMTCFSLMSARLLSLVCRGIPWCFDLSLAVAF